MSDAWMSDATRGSGGTIIAIGGHEDRDADRIILRAVAEAMCAGPLLVLATASRTPQLYYTRYRTAFEGIGVHDVRNLAVRDRTDAEDPVVLDLIAAAGGVFLTGGSQLRLVTPIRDTVAHRALRDLHARGGVIAGTSAGASALGECMVAGTREPRLSPGLGLLAGVMLDQHFAQRDRLGRLADAVSQTAECSGIGIDENTALVVRGAQVSVVGTGEAWVLDGRRSVRRVPAGHEFTLGDTIAA